MRHIRGPWHVSAHRHWGLPSWRQGLFADDKDLAVDFVSRNWAGTSSRSMDLTEKVRFDFKRFATGGESSGTTLRSEGMISRTCLEIYVVPSINGNGSDSTTAKKLRTFKSPSRTFMAVTSCIRSCPPFAPRRRRIGTSSTIVEHPKQTTMLLRMTFNLLSASSYAVIGSHLCLLGHIGARVRYVGYWARTTARVGQYGA